MCVHCTGIENLTNKNRGHLHGRATKFTVEQTRQAGVVMLRKAFEILLLDGERQIMETDVLTYDTHNKSP